MTPHQITLVQQSFEAVRPIAVEAAAMFYNRLFALDPNLRQLFRGDMQEQGRKLMQAIALVVQGLRTPDTILPAVAALGARHRDYGVRPEHYGSVGAALLWTLEQGLGTAFTPDVKDAWAAAYTMLAEAMQAPAAHA
jgi:hemoglobin-like flavoprotein